jgi:ribosomal protein S18 acetylase RimI-like enzyme
MPITYQIGKTLPLDQVFNLYEKLEWTAYTTHFETLRKGIENSLFVLSGWDEDQLVGLLRAVGDGHTIVYIQDILVAKDYQRQGIGTAMMRQALEHYRSVRQIVLMTDAESEAIPFYEQLGLNRTEKMGLQTFIRA